MTSKGRFVGGKTKSGFYYIVIAFGRQNVEVDLIKENNTIICRNHLFKPVSQLYRAFWGLVFKLCAAGITYL